MSRAEFMRRLSLALCGLPDEERFDILKDYSEHFDVGRAEGKTEEEIAARLGTPEELAATFHTPAAGAPPVRPVQNASPMWNPPPAQSIPSPSARVVLGITLHVCVALVLCCTVIPAYFSFWSLPFGLIGAALPLFLLAPPPGLALAGVVCVALGLFFLVVAFSIFWVWVGRLIYRLMKHIVLHCVAFCKRERVA